MKPAHNTSSATMVDFEEEYRLLKSNKLAIIAGADEVGRGAFAGPVVAGAVVFDSETGLALSSRIPLLRDGQKDAILGHPKIDDSKKLTARQREVASAWIKQNALAWGIGSASVSRIDKHGLTKATHFAFRSAIYGIQSKLAKPINYLLIDAFLVPNVRGIRRQNQYPIIGGDGKSFSIAAASIIAKVHRDQLMVSLGKKPHYSKYFWPSNKGYGTKVHREAIKNHGICRFHRKIFIRKLFEV